MLKDAIATAINAGVDMSMVPNNPEYKNYCKLFLELINERRVKTERLDDAVRRILRVKHKLNLFETSYTNKDTVSTITFNGCAALIIRTGHRLVLGKHIKMIIPILDLNLTAKRHMRQPQNQLHY